MKRLIPMLLLIFTAAALPLTAQASDAEGPHVTITVVMPEPAQGPEAEPAPFPALPEFPQPEPTAPEPDVPALYPTGVHEILENGARWIVRTYELGAGESPDQIPRGSFERGGWMYSVTDITKKETAAAEAKGHTETITVNTETKEMEAILRQLAPTMEFVSEDGYAGILTLDVSSIAVETAGTRTSSYTASAKREYPHLSSNDTSLVPKTITDGGRTLTLASVDWRTNHSATVDYEQIPVSYTAVATYTANASRTVVTGYVTTAEYKGEVSRLNQGRTVYTAYFMGTEILPERIPLEIVESGQLTVDSESADAGAAEDRDGSGDAVNCADGGNETGGGAIYDNIAADAGTEADAEQDADNEPGSNPLAVIIPAALSALLIGAGAGYYIPRIMRNRKRKGGTTT